MNYRNRFVLLTKYCKSPARIINQFFFVIYYHYFLLEITTHIMNPIKHTTPKPIRICVQFKLFMPIELFPCIIPFPVSQAIIKTINTKKQSDVVIVFVILLVFIIFSLFD
jgi:hypothetical protein